MVALTHSETQQTDLMAVALPWSVPTTGPSVAHLLTLFTKLVLCICVFESFTPMNKCTKLQSIYCN